MHQEEVVGYIVDEMALIHMMTETVTTNGAEITKEGICLWNLCDRSLSILISHNKHWLYAVEAETAVVVAVELVAEIAAAVGRIRHVREVVLEIADIAEVFSKSEYEWKTICLTLHHLF